ncbi:MAG: DNA polymerase III subunit beta [Prevotellaceae bacterium]|jgi:DNA polymerase-3 subunit beta|nr:DNA polymerase III subunit beta [Prevotellaceae bacterium]
MQFTVSSSALLSRLLSIGRVVNSKSTLPILENFLFKISDNTLTITATDLETTLTSTLAVENSTGNITLAVQAKLLLDTLREFPEQPLLFDIDEESLAVLIKTENGQFNFIGLSGDAFPKSATLSDESNHLILPVETLLTGISRASFAAASEEDLRPTMAGVFFDIKPEELTLVATDAHKLVRLKMLSVKSGIEASFILPKKSTAILKSILPKISGDVKISFDSQNILFELPEYTLICRQIEGRYPNYNGVIPTQNPFKIIVDRPAFLNAVRRVSVYSNQGTGLIKLHATDNVLLLSAQDIDFSTSAEESIPCQFSDESIEIGFKAPLLVDVLTNISASEVVIELADSTRAGILLPLENEQDEDLLMLLMPMLIA